MAIAALLMLSTMASCSDQDSQAPATGDEAYLNPELLYRQRHDFQSKQSWGHRKDDETQANPTAESDIHSIKVWVFKSETGASAESDCLQGSNTPTAVGGGTANGTYTLNLRILA